MIHGDLDVTGTIFGSISSDRHKKEEFINIDPQEILEKLTTMPITEWQYKGSTERHIGPMAQDFYAAYRLGKGETTIAPVDASGIAFAAIQALAATDDDQNEKISWLIDNNAHFEQENEKIKKQIDQLFEQLYALQLQVNELSQEE